MADVNKILRYGTQSQFDTAKESSTIVAESIYFITDTHRIYRGEELVGINNIARVTTLPEVADALKDIIYILNTSGEYSFHFLNEEGTAFVKFESGSAEAITPDGEATLTNKTIDATLNTITNLKTSNFASDALSTAIAPESPSDTKLTTEKAVSDAIAAAVDGIDLTPYDAAYVNVEAKAAEGTSGTILTFTTKGGSTKDVTIADLFLTAASYDSGTHVLTLTVGEDKTVEVNLEDLVPQSVNASQVAMAREITVTTTVGNLKAGDKVIITGDPQTGEVKAADVQAMFEAILSKDINPTTTQPSASITLTGAGEKEVGTQFTPSYNASLNPGKYSVQGQGDQASGVTATTYAITDNKEGSASTATGSFTAFTVEDDTDYYVSATISYGDGNIPKTFLGNNYPDGQIKAGSKSATSTHVKGFRNCWWGAKQSSNLIANPSAITATEIKALGNANKNKPTSLTASNMQQMFFAIPKGQATSLSIVGTNSPLPQTVSGPVTVQVGGVGDHAPIDYSVFYVANASPASGSETYKLTWK